MGDNTSNPDIHQIGSPLSKRRTSFKNPQLEVDLTKLNKGPQFNQELILQPPITQFHGNTFTIVPPKLSSNASIGAANRLAQYQLASAAKSLSSNQTSNGSRSVQIAPAPTQTLVTVPKNKPPTYAIKRSDTVAQLTPPQQQFVGTAVAGFIELTVMIARAVSDLRDNHQKCIMLSKRISLLSELAKKLVESPNHAAYKIALDGYELLIKNCADYIKKYLAVDQKNIITKGFTRLYHKDEDRAQFLYFNRELNRYTSIINGFIGVEMQRSNDANFLKVSNELAELKQTVQSLKNTLDHHRIATNDTLEEIKQNSVQINDTLRSFNSFRSNNSAESSGDKTPQENDDSADADVDIPVVQIPDSKEVYIRRGITGLNNH